MGWMNVDKVRRLIEVMTDPDGKPPLTMYGGYPEPF